MLCVFCENENIREFSDSRRTYAECSSCGGIFVLPEFFLFKWCQQRRYEQHRNTIENAGYVHFLESFIDPVLNFLPQKPLSILDYGSGPAPVLVEVLERRKSAESLPPECVIRGWDPFFNTKTPFFENGASLVTCLEVAEHFENPVAGFEGISRSLSQDGYAAVGTLPIPHGQDFLSWWYKEDPTHITFYTPKSINAAATSAGLQYVGKLTKRIFLFRKCFSGVTFKM